jgi:glycosyltransferase involved in cell wall biosynthesis
MSAGLDLSIVMGTISAARNIDAALETIAAATRGLTAEILVDDASLDGTADRASRHGASVVAHPHGALVPHLWAAGIRRARGHVIAVTTGHTTVGRGWAEALAAPLARPDVGGAGGPLRLAPHASGVDAGVFFLRYAQFLPSVLGEGPIAGELAADNAAYRRDDLLRDPATLADGFWELGFHKLLRARGLALWGVAAAVAEFGRAYPFATIAHHRFAHGRAFGAERVALGSKRPWQLVLGAPLVPGLLTMRAASRALADREHRARFVGALPVTLALASAWAVGEAVGAASARGAA